MGGIKPKNRALCKVTTRVTGVVIGGKITSLGQTIGPKVRATRLSFINPGLSKRGYVTSHATQNYYSRM